MYLVHVLKCGPNASDKGRVLRINTLRTTQLTGKRQGYGGIPEESFKRRSRRSKVYGPPQLHSKSVDSLGFTRPCLKRKRKKNHSCYWLKGTCTQGQERVGGCGLGDKRVLLSPRFWKEECPRVLGTTYFLVEWTGWIPGNLIISSLFMHDDADPTSESLLVNDILHGQAGNLTF